MSREMRRQIININIIQLLILSVCIAGIVWQIDGVAAANIDGRSQGLTLQSKILICMIQCKMIPFPKSLSIPCGYRWKERRRRQNPARRKHDDHCLS